MTRDKQLRYKLDLCHESIVTEDSMFLHSTKYLTLAEHHRDDFWQQRLEDGI